MTLTVREAFLSFATELDLLDGEEDDGAVGKVSGLDGPDSEGIISMRVVFGIEGSDPYECYYDFEEFLDLHVTSSHSIDQ